MSQLFQSWMMLFHWINESVMLVVHWIVNNNLFVKPEWALAEPAEWAIDSEAMRARGIILF